MESSGTFKVAQDSKEDREYKQVILDSKPAFNLSSEPEVGAECKTLISKLFPSFRLETEF